MHELLHSFDRTFARYIQLLPSWVSPIMNAATFLGEPAVVVSLAVAIALAAWIKQSRRLAYSQAAVLVAMGFNTIIKYSVHRSRPDTMYVAHMRIHSYSFPSGHSFGATVFYGLLAYLAWSRLPHPWNLLVVLLLVLLIILVGLSRVYLGAHFPSDVVVGWLLGGLSLFVIIKYIRP
jgi:undecaprenyl-diphosphatase